MFFERAGEGVMNAAGFDDDVFAVDNDGVFRGVAKLAVAERDIVSRDFYERSGGPLAVDEQVFVNTGFGDCETV